MGFLSFFVGRLKNECPKLPPVYLFSGSTSHEHGTLTSHPLSHISRSAGFTSPLLKPHLNPHPNPAHSMPSPSPTPLNYIQYSPTRESLYLPTIRSLISKDLSEPYSIYVYRYFLYQWGELCYLVNTPLPKYYSSTPPLHLPSHPRYTREKY